MIASRTEERFSRLDPSHNHLCVTEKSYLSGLPQLSSSWTHKKRLGTSEIVIIFNKG